MERKSKKFNRKDNQTNKVLFLIILLLGMGLIYLGFDRMHWTWNVLTLPLGLVLMISGYKNYKRSNRKIAELDFLSDRLHIVFLDGSKKEILNENLRYSLLVKKYYKPIRSIEFIEKKKISMLRGRSVGKIEITKWENEMEDIARHLIKGGFERKKWRFGWSIGDFLMILSIILGLAEGLAKIYVDEYKMNWSETTGKVGELLSVQREKTIVESIESEEKYLRKNNGVK